MAEPNITIVVDGGDNKPDSELYVAIVSLVIALVALLGTVMQVMQQYYASATGFANCHERVMGAWHETKERKFKPKELQFEVLFETPVMFVCPATNHKGPVETPVWHVSGTEDSQRETKTPVKKRERQQGSGDGQGQDQGGYGLLRSLHIRGNSTTGAQNARTTGLELGNNNAGGGADTKNARPRALGSRRNTGNTSSSDSSRTAVTVEKVIHTADNEKATWVTMLTELQRMEADSSEWQDQQIYRDAEVNSRAVANGSSGPLTVRAKERKAPPFKERTLVVAVQAKRRSWDTMPQSMKRPYATTTISHLVEMTAMLGLHWKEFDRAIHRYRAEGNGYMLTGTLASDLGVVFTFSVTGQSKFEDTRIIPVSQVKEFVFGIVPTFFNTNADERRLEFPSGEDHEFRYLVMGSDNEMAEAVAGLGCNTRTADIFRDKSKKHGHLFPVAFEIVGMLSQTLYVPNSPFRMVPNPTVYHWDKKFFDLRRLIGQFVEKLAWGYENPDGTPGNINVAELAQITDLKDRANRLYGTLMKGRARPKSPIDFNLTVCQELYDAIAFCDEFLLRNHTEYGHVEYVLREHIQQIMRVINSQAEPQSQQPQQENSGGSPIIDRRQSTSHSAVGAVPSVSGGGVNDVAESLTLGNDLSNAAPEQRHKVLMDIYFTLVLPHVIKGAVETIKRRDTYPRAPGLGPRSPSLTPQPSPPPSPALRPSPAAAASPLPASASSPTLLGPPGSPLFASVPQLQSDAAAPAPAPAQSPQPIGPVQVERHVTDVWCTLIFRMLCWLTLHDFHKNDVQVTSKTEVWGSRLPVYIG